MLNLIVFKAYPTGYLVRILFEPFEILFLIGIIYIYNPIQLRSILLLICHDTQPAK